VLAAGTGRAVWAMAERLCPSAARSWGEPGRRDWTTIRITKGKSFAASTHRFKPGLVIHMHRERTSENLDSGYEMSDNGSQDAVRDCV